MNDQDLRSLVRETIARHLGGGATPLMSGPASLLQQHASHIRLILPTGADADGPCLIEPAVACNHCGYCTSFGH